MEEQIVKCPAGGPPLPPPNAYGAPYSNGTGVGDMYNGGEAYGHGHDGIYQFRHPVAVSSAEATDKATVQGTVGTPRMATELAWEGATLYMELLGSRSGPGRPLSSRTSS